MPCIEKTMVSGLVALERAMSHARFHLGLCCAGETILNSTTSVYDCLRNGQRDMVRLECKEMRLGEVENQTYFKRSNNAPDVEGFIVSLSCGCMALLLLS